MFTNPRVLMNLLVFSSPAFVLVVWGSYTIVNLCLILVGIFVLLRRGYFSIDKAASKAGMFLGATLVLYSVLGIGLFAYHHEELKMYGQYVIFLLMPLAYWAVVGIGANQNLLWLGAATGGILSGLDAGYQILVLGADRAGGYMDNIQYGNIGVVLATASMLGIFHWIKSGQRGYPMLIVLILGAIGGACTSLFSGSKGGWLSLLTAIVVLDQLVRPYWSSGKRRGALIAIFALAAFMVALPQSPVHKRLNHAWQDYLMWSSSGSTAGGSVGPRLELWRFGLSVADERPLLGFGYKGLMTRKSEAVAAEGFDQGIDVQPGLHNHFLHTYITYGVIGLVNVGILLLLPWSMFIKKWHEKKPQSEALAMMGMLLVLVHIEFGMSNSLFELNAVRQIYLFWLIVLMGLLHHSPGGVVGESLEK